MPQPGHHRFIMKKIYSYLKLSEKIIPIIGEDISNILCGPITVPQTNCSSKCSQKYYLVEKPEQRMDALLMTRKVKLLLYKAGIYPQLCWDLSIMTLLLSWVRAIIEAKVMTFLNRWFCLVRLQIHHDSAFSYQKS